jgi:hypothetical protein
MFYFGEKNPHGINYCKKAPQDSIVNVHIIDLQAIPVEFH